MGLHFHLTACSRGSFPENSSINFPADYITFVIYLA